MCCSSQPSLYRHHNGTGVGAYGCPWFEGTSRGGGGIDTVVGCGVEEGLRDLEKIKIRLDSRAGRVLKYIELRLNLSRDCELIKATQFSLIRVVRPRSIPRELPHFRPVLLRRDGFSSAHSGPEAEARFSGYMKRKHRV